MPNDRKANIRKLRQPSKQDRHRDVAIGLDKSPRSRAFDEILRGAIALAADRGGIRQFSPIPATYRFPSPNP